MPPYHLQLRRDPAALWNTNNPILADGEPGYEEDSGLIKVGDGSSFWTARPYSVGQPYWQQPVMTTPEKHGAVRDGTTDDTLAIRAAIMDVFTRGRANGSNHGQVWFSPGVYALLGGMDTSQKARAQVSIPWNLGTNATFELEFIFPGGTFNKPHWNYTGIQKGGTVFLTNLNAATDGALGDAQVFGSATQQQVGTTVFTNVHLVTHGGWKVVSTYQNPLHVAFDLQGVVSCEIDGMSANGDVNGGGINSPSAGGIAIRMPLVGNNAMSRVGSSHSFGYTNGFLFSEHTHAQDVHVVNAVTACAPGSGYYDSARIEHLCTEACVNHLTSGNAGQPTHLDIGSWEVEDSLSTPTTYHLWNIGSGYLRGTCQAFHRNCTAPTAAADGLVGADLPPIWNTPGYQYKIISTHVASYGPQTPPAVPASGTAFPRVFRDTVYIFTGGTGVSFSLGGVAQGVASGTIFVPSGVTLVPTYTTAPTLAAFTII